MVAVLDWELCTLGHPFADMAYISTFSLLTPATAITAGISGEREEEKIITCIIPFTLYQIKPVFY